MPAVDSIAEADSSVSLAAREAALGVSVVFDVVATPDEPGTPGGGSGEMAAAATVPGPDGGAFTSGGSVVEVVGAVDVAGAAPVESDDMAGDGAEGSEPGRPAFGGVISLMTMGRRVSYAKR